MDVSEAVLVLAGGLAAGTVNAIIGSGTLITFPLLLAAGLPPVVANVTNTVGLVPGSLTAVAAYRDVLAEHRRPSARLAACSLAGSLAGAALLLTLPEDAFALAAPVLVLAALVLVVVQPRLARALAARRRPAARRGAGPLALVAIALAGVYGGYFGAAQGIVLFAILATALPDDLPRVNATRNLLAAVANGVAAVVFVLVADVDWAAAATIAVGAAAGGVLGARVGRRLSARALRAVVVVVGLAAVVQLVR